MKRIAASVALGLGLLFGSTAMASAATTHHLRYTSNSSATVGSGTGTTSASGGSGTTAGSGSTSATSSQLAFTGADVAGTVAVGFGLIGGGLIIVRTSRKRNRLA